MHIGWLNKDTFTWEAKWLKILNNIKIYIYTHTVYIAYCVCISMEIIIIGWFSVILRFSWRYCL